MFFHIISPLYTFGCRVLVLCNHSSLFDAYDDLSICLANNLDKSVSLELDNFYTCPSDGYLLTVTKANSNSYTNVLIYDASKVYVASVVTPAFINWNNSVVTFIRKGMRLKMVAGDGINEFATFYSLT